MPTSNSVSKDLSNMLEEIIVSIICATIFSYFLGESLTLFHNQYTNLIYRETDIFSSNFIRTFIMAYGPPVIFILIDIVLFITVFYVFFNHYKENIPKNPLKQIFNILIVLLPASTIPWPLQHIFTYFYIETKLFHLFYLPIWLMLSILIIIIPSLYSRLGKKFLFLLFFVIIIVSAIACAQHEKKYGKYQTIMFKITSERFITRFRTIYDENYNYTELVKWINTKITYAPKEDIIHRHLDPFEILAYSKGRCEEFSIAYVAACWAQGIEARLILSYPPDDHSWAEVKINETWIHVDPSGEYWDKPYYRFDDGMNITKVIAFETFYFYKDVTSNYTR